MFMVNRLFSLLVGCVSLTLVIVSPSTPAFADPNNPSNLAEIKTGSPSHPGMVDDTSSSGGFLQTRLGASYVPRFNTGNNAYRVLYGDPGTMFTARVDYYFFDWFATIGIGTQLGYYRDSGFAYDGNQGPGDIDPNQVQRDQSTDLILIPWQLFATVLITPFTDHKWVTLNGFAGIERMYVQETRVNNGASSEDGNWYIKGYNNGALLGFAANFRLDSWSRDSRRSLQSMGISKLFLTAYLAKIEQKRNFSDFSREEIGLQFTFESY